MNALFIGSISFVVSVIAAKIVFIILTSPVLLMPSVSNSNILSKIILIIGFGASFVVFVFCFKKIYKYLYFELI